MIEYVGSYKDFAYSVLVEDAVLNYSATLNPRHDLRNHSPNGFAWGYAGSGPSQLALAMCADALAPTYGATTESDQRALRIYQQFKVGAIMSLTQTCNWRMTKAAVVQSIVTIEQALRQIEEEQHGCTDHRV